MKTQDTPAPHPSQRLNVQFNKGEHGFDNKVLDMKTIFRAVGPSFRRGLEVEPFESVHVYELLCKLLRIVPEANDGDPSALLPMLTPEGEGGPSTPSTTTHSGEALPSPAPPPVAADGVPALEQVPPSHVGRLLLPCPQQCGRVNRTGACPRCQTEDQGCRPRGRLFGVKPLQAPGPGGPRLHRGIPSWSHPLPAPHPHPPDPSQWQRSPGSWTTRVGAG